MTTTQKPQTIHLKDYTQTPFLITDVDLTFDLEPEKTVVTSKLKMQRRSPERASEPLYLDGENLELVSIHLDGGSLDESQYEKNPEQVILRDLPDKFELSIVTVINPQKNTTLEGLYMSDGFFCTQNESQGFRKITYFYDRPDVLAKYRTKIIADKKCYPVLLSNGNPIESGEGGGGRHYVVWEDPFPKPCYLYALVAGDLGCVQESFTTMSGRTIDLRIYVDKGNESQCDYAMGALKRAMKWDEESFGRECDLDTYMIVAVSAFNFGAMENKGLNVFNSQYILANPKIATDQNYEAIESVIGHEYFHNWSGNRVTCRDWFQITLKEGLTIFRDQEFSADMTSRAVKRISDVKTLRDYQFAEDAGPNAHPIQPKSYIEVNNFYTSTVYQKGSEVIRMIHTLIGKKAFGKGLESYFEIHDGQAVTTEEFVSAMEKASGKDLGQFRRWYDQLGTPRCHVSSRYEEGTKRYTLVVTQKAPANQPQEKYQDLFFPLKVGLIGKDGSDLIEGDDASQILEVNQEKQEFVFEQIKEKPVPSLLRGFSAPVELDYDYTLEELAFLFSNDSDPFNRYEAGQRLAQHALKGLVKNVQEGTKLQVSESILKAYSQFLEDDTIDNQFKAYAFSLPSLSSLIETMSVCDFRAAFEAREALAKSFAKRMEAQWHHLYTANNSGGAYETDQTSIGKRALKNTSLAYLSYLEGEESAKKIYEQCMSADNMTDEIAALSILANLKTPLRDQALKHFYDKWKGNALVMNKWFVVQAVSKNPDTLKILKKLESDSAFDVKNPNKVRSLFGAFSQNLIRFHDESGEGYAWIAEKILEIDTLNPKSASHLATGFKKYAKLPPNLKVLMKAQLERILAEKNLSQDTYEIISKTTKTPSSKVPGTI